MNNITVWDFVDGVGKAHDKPVDMGEGFLGNRGVANFMKDSRFSRLPILLESPGDNKAEQIKRVYKYCD